MHLDETDGELHILDENLDVVHSVGSKLSTHTLIQTTVSLSISQIPVQNSWMVQSWRRNSYRNPTLKSTDSAGWLKYTKQ